MCVCTYLKASLVSIFRFQVVLVQVPEKLEDLLAIEVGNPADGGANRIRRRGLVAQRAKIHRHAQSGVQDERRHREV